MTKTELVQMLGWRLGDRDDVGARVDLELAFLQDYVLETKPWAPWFLLTEEATVVTVAGERRLPLPEDFLLEDEDSHLFLTTVDGSSILLQKVEFDNGAVKWPGEGTPVAYTLKGTYIQFFPIPDAAYTVQMHYYGKDASLSTDFANSKWLKYAGDLVAAELGKVLAEKHYRDAAAAAAFAADAQLAWKRLYDKHTAMQEINSSRVMGVK